jgi:hypothetical protein
MLRSLLSSLSNWIRIGMYRDKLGQIRDKLGTCLLYVDPADLFHACGAGIQRAAPERTAKADPPREPMRILPTSGEAAQPPPGTMITSRRKSRTVHTPSQAPPFIARAPSGRLL